MQDLLVDQIIGLHTAIIARDGGDGRLLSEGNLHQLTFRANRIPDPVRRAAFCFYSLIAYPAFREGNETMARELAVSVLRDGGYNLDPTCNGTLDQLADGITGFTVELEDTEGWFQARGRKES
jgi:prophage maintenance system killer protein